MYINSLELLYVFRSIIEDFEFPLELEKLGCPERTPCIITNDRQNLMDFFSLSV